MDNSFTKLVKDSRCHRIELEIFDENDQIDTTILISAFNSLAMTLKPLEKKSLTGKNFKLTVQAKKNFKMESFLAEHIKFLDELKAKEN